MELVESGERKSPGQAVVVVVVEAAVVVVGEEEDVVVVGCLSPVGKPSSL